MYMQPRTGNNPDVFHQLNGKANGVVHPYHRLLLSNEKEKSIDLNTNLEGHQGNYADWKIKTTSKGYILYDSIFIAFLK